MLNGRGGYRFVAVGCALSCLVVLSSTAALAAHRRRGEQQAAPAADVLANIQVLGGRQAPFALDARAEYMIDAHTGVVLYAWNEHQRIQPASLAKIMTFYITLEALKNGKVSLKTEIPVSEQAWRLSINKTVSKMFLEVGQKVALSDLLYGLMVSSGNDAALAISEYLGGSTDGFVAMMNQQATELGLTDTRFASPDGLPEPDQYTTAADMVKLTRILLQRHPEALTFTSVKEFTFHNITQRNWNTLLFYDSRVNGLKTGHVDEAGFHLVATAHSGNLFFISALMGAPNAEKRRTETEKLLDWAFRTFVDYQPQWHGMIPQQIRVYEGTQRQVAIAPAETVDMTVYRGDERHLKLSADVPTTYLRAPVAKGTEVGRMILTMDGKEVRTIPVQTTAEVSRGGFFRVLWDKLRFAVWAFFHGIGAGLHRIVHALMFWRH